MAADDTAASAEGGPSTTPVLLDPYRQKQRCCAVTDICRSARQKHPRKHADIQAERLLVQEAKFRSEFDVAEAEVRLAQCGTIETRGQCSGQLKIRRSAIVEIDPRGAADSATRGGAVAERIYLAGLVVGRLPIVQDIRRTAVSVICQCKYRNQWNSSPKQDRVSS